MIDAATFLRIDELGELWFEKPNAEPVLLSALDNLCGIWLFTTGVDDPFLVCCEYHDHLYRNRKFFEERGWTRFEMDEFFLKMMLDVAGENVDLQLRAKRYYQIVRLIGGTFYYRHEPAAGGIRHRAHPNPNIRRP